MRKPRFENIMKRIHNADRTFNIWDDLEPILGERLGKGTTREVFALKHYPAWVVKLEMDDAPMINIMEYETYAAVWDGVQDWLCPIWGLSHHGLALYQRKTIPVTKEELPERIPSWLTDTKIENWGRLMPENRIVCHDFGMNLALQRGMTRRLKKAEWWSVKDYEKRKIGAARSR